MLDIQLLTLFLVFVLLEEMPLACFDNVHFLSIVSQNNVEIKDKQGREHSVKQNRLYPPPLSS